MNLRAWDILRMRWRSLTRRSRVETELEKELRFHLEEQVAENLALGMTPGEARDTAMRRFGGRTQIQEECRDMRRTNYVENFRHDVRYAARTLAKNPGFAAVIVLTLALSIGANSAIFSVIDGVMLRPLPYPNAGRIVRIFYSNKNYPKFPVNHWDLRDFRERNRSFEGMALYSPVELQLSGDGEPLKLSAFATSGGYFGVLGLRPARGRDFDTGDELPGKGRQVILSDRLWRNRFAADPNIVGRKIMLDSVPYTVSAVMPPGAQHPGNSYHSVPDGETVDAWVPFTFEGNPARRGSHYTEGIGRLKPGISAERAAAELNAILGELARTYSSSVGWTVKVATLYQELVGPARRMLLVLLGAVALVVLIACANAANLLLARATSRQREIAVRAALGAGRSRLVRQMLAESLLISLLGGGLGAGVAALGVKALVALLPAGFPRAGSIHLDAAVFWFTLTVALTTGMLFGLAPALHALRTDLQQNLGGRGSTSSAQGLWLRNALVVGEISLACVLLIGAGLMLRSFINLLNMDRGFRPEQVMTASITLPQARYKDIAAMVQFYDRLLTDLGAIPGVKSAGAATDLPWTGYDENISGFTVEGKVAAPGQEYHARFHVASADYFRALGIPLIRGRFADEHDTKDEPLKLVINQTMASRLWPGEEAIGKRITFADNPKVKDWMTVVGVVGDIKDRPESARAEPAFWWPVLQEPWPFPNMSVAIRSSSSPGVLVSQMRDAVRRLDPDLAVAKVRMMDQVTDANVSTPRFTLFLVGLFAALALTLAGIGMYGVIAYSVSRRTHEFGLRMALGAKPGDVRSLVLGQGLRLAVAGVALGILSGLALARLLRALLYEVTASDPATFVVVSVVGLAIATLACYLPALRATRADPMAALRSE